MPELQDLWSEVSQERDDLVFLCVNIGDDKDVIAKWWEEDGFTMSAVRQDGDAVSQAFGVMAYPTNYVIGPEGKVLYRGVGWDAGAVKRLVAK
ncbi:MAG: TlpA family protein disulfide reductase [Planctomycetes bacterium]|nr:TlpA family protein disulfide reductase [Planctomycetota bacterium]MBL7007703.1 TlpA family protein disulfide reductase [Planctomycetota bacterium]